MEPGDRTPHRRMGAARHADLQRLRRSGRAVVFGNGFEGEFLNGGWWLVVSGWWLVDDFTTHPPPTNHQPPTTNLCLTSNFPSSWSSSTALSPAPCWAGTLTTTGWPRIRRNSFFTRRERWRWPVWVSRWPLRG